MSASDWSPAGEAGPRRAVIEDAVRVFAVGNCGAALEEHEIFFHGLDGCDAGAQVAAHAEFRSARGEQPLVAHEVAQVIPEKLARAVVADDAADLHLVHGENHAGGSAGLAEHGAERRHVRHGTTQAAEFGGNRAGKKFFFAQCGDGLLWKAAFAVNARRGGPRHVRSDAFGFLDQASCESLALEDGQRFQRVRE